MRHLIVLTVVLLANVAVADEPLSIADWLAKPILDEGLPLREVQEYCESRVPAIPQVSSVEEWERIAKQARIRTLRNVVLRGEAAMSWAFNEGQVEFLETIDGGPEYRIRKLRYEAVPDMWIPALLYEPKQLEGKVPVVLNVNGHDRKDGKAAEYKQKRCINLAKRGMLALNVEWIGMGQLHTDGNSHYHLNQLDLFGNSGLAPFYLSMSRGLDILLDHEHADPDRVAVAGLSGGGWQTIFISSLDERVTLSDPVAGYSSFRTRARFPSDLGDSEQTPVDLAVYADYAKLTAMRAPRPTLLTFNLKDNCCFASPHALPPLMDAALPIYKLYNKADHLRWHVNEDPGNHNFGVDNRQALYRMIGDFFYANDPEFDASEIECDDEVKSFDELLVDLPDNTATLHDLAVKLSDRKLSPPPPEDRLPHWRRSMRSQLQEIVRWRPESVPDEALLPFKVSGDDWKPGGEMGKTTDGVHAMTSIWNISDTWSVPGVLFEKDFESRPTVLMIADDGRASLTERVEHHLARNNNVLAIDPFYFGESSLGRRDFLYALLVSATGDRPIGIQARQLATIARFHGYKEIEAHGPRSSLIALIAAAIDGSGFESVRLHGSFKQLREIIEQDITVNKQPELFCFGLAEKFDIPHLVAIAGEDRVHFE